MLSCKLPSNDTPVFTFICVVLLMNSSIFKRKIKNWLETLQSLFIWLSSSVNSVFTLFLLLLKGSPDPAVLSDDEDAGHTSGLHGVQRWAEGWVGFVTIQTFTLTVSFKTPIRTTTALLMTFLSKFLQQFTVYFFQSELNWAFLFRL